MPSSRRSQNLPLEDPLIPSSTSSRSKKPSGKAKADAAGNAKADAARKAKADAAARTIVEAATAKANTAGAAAKANCPRNSKGHIIGNSKAAKKAREAHAVELQRRADAADRVRAQISQEKRARSAEVARFGEEETLRRRREEREARNTVDELPTSDIEAMGLEDRIADPTLKISACLRVDKRLEWSTSVGTQASSSFNIWDFEQLLEDAISKRDGHNKGWEITHRMVIVRASRSKATRKLQSIDDFTEAEWNKVLEVIASEGAIEYDVRIELQAESLKGKSSLKRSLDVLSSDPLEPSSPKATRITRTDKLLDRVRIRADSLAAAGNFDRELLHRWQCNDKQCRNLNG